MIDGSNKRRLVLKAVFFLLLFSSFFGIFASLETERRQVIRVAFLGSKEDEDYGGALVFKRVVEEMTSGYIEVQVYPAGQFCGNARECLEAVQVGTLDVTMTTAGGVWQFIWPRADP